jgi:hypothetical protein
MISMIRNFFTLALSVSVLLINASLLTANDPTSKTQKKATVAVSLQIIEIDKADLEVFKVMLDLTDGTKIKTPSTASFAHSLDQKSLDKINKGLVQLEKAKVLAAPDLIIADGTFGTFLSGGEFPVPTMFGVGQKQTMSFKSFGTSLSIKPSIASESIDLNLTCEFTELLPDQAVNGIPGFRTRVTSLAAGLKPEQVLVISGEFATNPLPEKKPNGLIDRIPNVQQLFRQKAEPNNSRLIVCVSAKKVEHPTIRKAGAVKQNLQVTKTIPATVRDTPRLLPSIVHLDAINPGKQYVTPPGFVPRLEILSELPQPFNAIELPKTVSTSRLQSMRNALVHLKAAGLEEQAKVVKSEIQKLARADAERSLKQKTEQLKQLQSEISILRQAVGDENE